MANVLHSIQSRLKSRKVLGVGESIDGKIPRSKISQLLGCNHMEPWSLLTEDYPIGLRMFQRLMCLAFILFGSVNLYFPEKFYGNFVCSASSEEFVPSLRHLTVEIRASYADMTSSRQEELEKQLEALEKATLLSTFPAKMYGGALLSLGLVFLVTMMWSENDRRSTRLTLFLQAVFLTTEIIVAASSILPTFSGTMRMGIIQSILTRGVAIGLAIFFFIRLSERPRDSGLKRQD